MNHLFQQMRHTGKTATGYKVQLAVHRMSAQLPASYAGVEMCAVITRHKKRVVTKCACYAADKKEIVWGDILPFTCTLYLAKTGLYQPKLFTVQIFDTRTDSLVATFEFNLSEHVQSSRDASKESIKVPTVKCHDSRASLSLTIVASKATSRATRPAGEPEGSLADEVSFDGSRSDMSVITLDSKSSRASMSSSRHGRQHGSMTSPHGDSKSDVLRGANPANDASDPIEMYGLRCKNQELHKAVQDLEEQLRQRDSDNAKLEKKVTEKDQAIQKLQAEKDELEQQLVETEYRGGTPSDSAQRGESLRYTKLKEEKQELLKEVDELRQTLRDRAVIPPPLKVTVNKVDQGEVGEKSKDSDDSDSDSDSDDDEQHEQEEEKEEEPCEAKRSEVSSVNEYVDAHETQLIAEINELKQTLHTVKSENQQQRSAIADLTKLKDQLTHQLQGLEGKVEMLESENDSQRRRLEDQESELRRTNEVGDELDEMDRRRRAKTTEVRDENEKLVQQLSHLDHIVTQLKNEKAALAEKLKQTESSQSRAQREMQDAQDAIGQLSGTNQAMNEQLEVAHEANTRARLEIESAQVTINELRDQVREISEKLQATQDELERVRDVELASSTAAAAAAIVKNQELQGRWDDLKVQNDQLQTRVEELEQKLAQTEASGEEREADLQRQVEELKQETVQLREELDELRASKLQAEEVLRECTAALQQALENQQRLALDHEQQVTGLEMQKADARALIEQQLKEKEALEAAMKNRVAELEKENDYFQGELIDSKMKLAELMVKNEELSSQYHRVEKNLNELKAKAAEAASAAPPSKKNKKHRFDRRVERSETEPTWLDAASATARRPRKSLSTMEPACPPDSAFNSASNELLLTRQAPMYVEKMDTEMTTPRDDDDDAHKRLILLSAAAHAQEPAVEDEEHTPSESAPLRRVRELLREMLTAGAWGERDHEDWERRKMQELRECVLDEAALESLQKLPKRMCAYEFKPGDIAWNCKVCQVDETCVMCNDCFISSDHENHEVFFYYTHSGGCCDCGDTEAWASDGFCTQHRGAHDVDPLVYFPPELLASARACLGEVLSLILHTITEARAMPVIDTSDVDRVRAKLAFEPADQRYSVLVHFNEMQSSQEFATALTRALPAISYQTLKIVGEATAQKQSVIRSRATREEAIDVVDAMCRHGLVTSIVSSDYKAKTPVVSTLLQWVVSMANLSDGFCRLVCEQFIAHTYESTLADAESSQDLDGKQYEDEFPVLRAVILADSFLPKHGSDALHSLLMALLADPVFKKAFAVAFTRCYRQLYREFFVGVGSSSVTILTFSVQFFNRASFVKLLVLDHELLEVLVVSVLETLRRKPRRLPLLPPDSPVDESSPLLEVLAPYFAGSSSRTVKQWDLLAFGIQRTIAKGLTTLYDVDVPALEAEAARQGLVVLKNADTSDGTSVFATLPLSTELPGRFELDVASPVFVYRRYMSGLLDLRYALQIEGISELFVLEKNGARLAGFLLYLSYIQGVCPEVRRFGDHVEVESRAWVVTVEFVSTATDVFTWIIANVFKHVSDDVANDSQLRPLIAKLTHTIMEAYYFWLASTGKYFPSSDFQMGKPLTAHPVDVAVSCHFPLHRALAQFIRTLCDSPRGLEIFYELINNSDGNAVETSPWVHGPDHSIGFWHRVNLIEPVLQAIVWDAEVHSGLWVRNGLSVLNHSMNYGEPPFCLRFRDLDLLVVQFGFQLLGIEWMMNSVMNRFGAADWLLVENSDSRDAELMVSECLVLLCQFASELPPRVVPEDPLRSLMVFLRREIVQRLIVGPCAHSDLTKTATDFFGAHENLFASKFSTAPLLDQIIKEICVDTTGTSNWATSMGDTSSNSGGGKVQYRLKPELFAEYQPTFVHSTRKQHEAAHENWFQHRLRVSKAKEQQQDDVATAVDATQSTWLDFPLVKNVLPCASGFRSARLSILHAHARRLVYETLWKASTDARSSLNLLSRAVHLFTVQVYVLEEVRYKLTILATSDADELYREEATRLVDEFTSWLTTEQLPLNADPNNQSPRTSVIGLLLKLDPWLPGNGTSTMVNLDGDQKHEIGRGVDWLVHRLARLDGECEKIVEQHRMTRHASKEEEDRKALLIKRRREAQMRAIQQMQQRQAAFAFQMQMMTEAENDEEDAAANDAEASDRVSIVPVAEGRASIAADIPMEDFGDGEVSLPECAMCHSTESENSFMCYVGFAQCSPVFSRVNGDKGRYLSTPMDEMHLGEDVPVHVRLCGHSVHHTCWESYHASQFQRAITGGHHRHALNAVDVTKKEFLCPLCKSISNVLIPTTTDELNQCLDQRIVSDETVPSHGDLMAWLESVGRANLRDSDEIMEEEDQEQKTERPVAAQLEVVAPAAVELSPRVRAWLEDGLSSLCMAIHKVACGATQKSRPDRYTASGCLALFHTLLCTFLGSPERDQLRPEQRFLEAMRFVPLMLQQVTKPPRTANGTPAAPFSAVATPRRQLSHLLYYGGSEILPDGTIVLEDQHPSTQTQTRKQSQWGKVRWPMKPLLLSQLGSLLVKGILLAESEQEAIIYGRLVVLARLVQTLLWFSITRHEDYTDKMADELEPSEKSMQFFVATMFDEPNRSNAAAAEFVEQLRVQVLEQCGAMVGVSSVIDDPHKLLNIVATEVVPMLKVTTFLLKARFNPQRFTSKLAMKPVFVNEQDVHSYGFVRVDSLWAQSADIQPVVGRWVQRFKAAYDEMNDPQGVLAQWFSTANMDKAVDAKLDYARVLARDLNTVHTSMSVYASGSNRMRYLRALPRAYVKFYAALAKRKCAACNQFPARPAVCLCCGLLLCAASTCPSIHHDKGYPEESNPGACTVHAKKCGRGSCMFLLVLEGAVLLVYWKLAAYVGSLYVDEYGEEFGERNRELSKGRPLFLNAERRDRLLRLWMHHEIPNEVVRIQNSSDRVIRNSHY